MLMQIGRLELKRQKFLCHLEGTKDKRFQRGPFLPWVSVSIATHTVSDQQAMWYTGGAHSDH